jgi:heme exporter protein D
MMHWSSVGEFLAMGGYAAYVWPAFGLTCGCMALELWLLHRRAGGARR